MDSFEKYNWLWKKKIDKELNSFNDGNPQLEDFENKLSDFAQSEAEVGTILIQHQIGALSLKTNNVKTGLHKWIVLWKDAYAKDLLKKAQTNIDNLTEEIKHIRLKIEKPAKDVDSLGNVMYALEEIRKKQSTIEIEFRPVIEMYNLLENYLDDEDINKEGNKDPSQIINKDWDELVQQAVQVRNNLQGQQSDFKKTLIVGVKVLVEDVVSFRKNFEENGPMVAGIEPKEALNRLKLQSEEYQIRERKFNSYNAGEVLFGLPHQSYPELEKTKKEIDLLDKLYSLYSKVKDTISKWKDVPWTEISEERSTMVDQTQTQLAKMVDQTDTFGRDCQKLPGPLKQWDAYKELKQEIDDMALILPLVQSLADPSIKPRHWDEIIEMTKEQIPYDDETFLLKDLLAAPLLKHNDDILDIAESAVKQLKLEATLNGEISQFWEECELEVKGYKNVEACMLGGNIQDIQEKLEEHIMALNQMNAMRYVTPFKTIVLEKITSLSETADIIEKWLKV